MRLGDSDKLRIGERVVAIGQQFGLTNTVTAGWITGLHRDIGAGPYDDFIQIDVAYKGLSGAPLFNLDGEVIGIFMAMLAPPSGQTAQIGFAVPSRLATPVIEQLRQHGEVARGWIGVQIQSLTAEIAESLGMSGTSGALVTSVDERGPAMPAGIEMGDVILRANNRTVENGRALAQFVGNMLPGAEVELLVRHQGKEETRNLTLARLETRPAAVAASTPPSRSVRAAPPPSARLSTLDPKLIDRKPFGLEVAALTRELRIRYKIADGVNGVAITRVAAQGAAAQEKLAPGEVIVEAGQEPVATPDDLFTRVAELKLSGRKSVLLLVAKADGALRFLALSFR